MRKLLYIKIFLIFFLGLILTPIQSTVEAQTAQTGKPACLDGIDNDGDGKIDFGNRADNDPDCISTSDTSEAGSIGSSTTPRTGDNSINIKIKNPLGDTDTIPEAIKKIMDVILQLVFPFIVLLFIYAGFLFVTARGNTDKLKQAKTMFWYTLIGTLLILGAWTIATAIVNTVNEITG